MTKLRNMTYQSNSQRFKLAHSIARNTAHIVGDGAGKRCPKTGKSSYQIAFTLALRNTYKPVRKSRPISKAINWFSIFVSVFVVAMFAIIIMPLLAMGNVGVVTYIASVCIAVVCLCDKIAIDIQYNRTHARMR